MQNSVPLAPSAASTSCCNRGASGPMKSTVPNGFPLYCRDQQLWEWLSELARAASHCFATVASLSLALRLGMKASMVASSSSGKSAQEAVGSQCRATLCGSHSLVASCQKCWQCPCTITYNRVLPIWSADLESLFGIVDFCFWHALAACLACGSTKLCCHGQASSWPVNGGGQAG